MLSTYDKTLGPRNPEHVQYCHTVENERVPVRDCLHTLTKLPCQFCATDLQPFQDFGAGPIGAQRNSETSISVLGCGSQEIPYRCCVPFDNWRLRLMSAQARIRKILVGVNWTA